MTTDFAERRPSAPNAPPVRVVEHWYAAFSAQRSSARSRLNNVVATCVREDAYAADAKPHRSQSLLIATTVLVGLAAVWALIESTLMKWIL
ncbi:hypothetical protein sphantq_04652 (plasmid) [Sphingobium sp. AntQ-1]|nr:hypothetical protein sphantq_04652 [Sphingobium sp. AntQ-1]